MNNLKLVLAGSVTALALLAPSVLLAQSVYRIVGSDGKVTFSDRAPVAAANATSRAVVGAIPDANVQNANLPFALRQVVARYPVALYSGAGCVPCNSGRLLLQARGVPYVEHTISSNEDIEALQRLSGDKSLPFLTIGGQKIKGFSDAEWSQFLSAANYPLTSQLPGNFQHPAAKPLVSTQKIVPASEAAQMREVGSEQPTAAAPPPAPAAGRTPGNPAGIKF